MSWVQIEDDKMQACDLGYMSFIYSSESHLDITFISPQWFPLDRGLPPPNCISQSQLGSRWWIYLLVWVLNWLEEGHSDLGSWICAHVSLGMIPWFWSYFGICFIRRWDCSHFSTPSAFLLWISASHVWQQLALQPSSHSLTINYVIQSIIPGEVFQSPGEQLEYHIYFCNIPLCNWVSFWLYQYMEA